MIQKHFQLIFVFLCFGAMSIIYYMTVQFGPYKMVSCDFQQIGHLYGFKWDSMQSE